MAFELGGGGKHKVRPSMNVTPLVDVVLVLLIIFMVITPMMVKQFRMHVPKQDKKAAEPATTADDTDVSVVLSLHADGTVWINRDRIALPDLPDKLARIFAARSDRVLFFDADDSCSYGEAMAVLDAARGGGARDIAVLTDPAVK